MPPLQSFAAKAAPTEQYIFVLGR